MVHDKSIAMQYWTSLVCQVKVLYFEVKMSVVWMLKQVECWYLEKQKRYMHCLEQEDNIAVENKSGLCCGIESIGLLWIWMLDIVDTCEWI